MKSLLVPEPPLMRRGRLGGGLEGSARGKRFAREVSSHLGILSFLCGLSHATLQPSNSPPTLFLRVATW